MNTATTAAKSDEQGPFRLNPYQQAAARAYDRDFAYLAEMEFKNFEAFREHLRDTVSDGLLSFILTELNDVDCDTAAEAQNRISRAIDQMNDVFGALCAIEDEAAPAPASAP